MGSNPVEAVDERWRDAHRRLWRFLVLAPYAIFAPLVALIPLRTHLERRLVLIIAVAALVALAVYVVVGFVAIWRVYAALYRRQRVLGSGGRRDSSTPGR